jgi:hypothetical protein
MNTDVEIAKIVEDVINGKTFYAEIERGSGFAKDLLYTLRGKGFVERDSRPSCRVATFEASLSNGVMWVDIVSGVFMGPFTKVHTGPVQQVENGASEHPFYVTSFCNYAHSLIDGKAIGHPPSHECYQLSPTKLRLEREFGANAVNGSVREFYPGEKAALKKKDKAALERLFWREAPSMTLDEAIDQLTELRRKSPLRGATVLHVCLVDSGVPYLQPKRIRLESGSKDDAMIVFDTEDPEGGR